MMANKIQKNEVEKTLLEQLSKANLSKEQLSSISKSISTLQKSGFQVIDWTQFGKPAFEKFVFEAQLPAEKANAIQGLFGTTNWKEIFIYRKGVPPMPNFFNVKLAVENL